MSTNQKAVTTIAAVIVFVGLMLLSPAIALPVAVLAGIVVFRARHHEQPIATASMHMTQRWYLWLAAGAILFGIGYATLAISGEDASTVVWATWVLSWLFASIAAVIGVTFGTIRLTRRS